MTNLYTEWKKLRDNVKSASASLYLRKNENTENKYEEALEKLAQFEKENGIPLMADEADVKKRLCPQTNFDNVAKDADMLAKFLSNKIHFYRFVSCDECTAYLSEDECKDVTNAELWSAWLKQPHTAE